MAETSSKAELPPGAWVALKHPLFRSVWVATVVSNVGTWFEDVAGAWLMTSLSSSPLLISLVQAAGRLPVFLLAVPSGALSDVLDRRRLLIAAQIWMALCSGTMGVLALMHLATPGLILALAFAAGLGAALTGPAWQSIVPELVPPRDLPSAVALNSVGINLARSIGPAIAGVIVAATGAGIGFLVNAGSFVGVIGVLKRWRRTVETTGTPSERFAGSIRAGLRYVRHSPGVRAVLVRNAGFVAGASALWALLPIVARHQLHSEATGYGLCLGSIGAGALLGAAVLPKLRAALSPDKLVLAGGLLFAAVQALLAEMTHLWLACVVLLGAGMAWMSVLSTLSVSAQGAVPGWVRGRALSTYILTWYGMMAAGSAGWGALAEVHGTSSSLLIASAMTALLAFALLPMAKLPIVTQGDLNPSRHWPDPELLETPEPDAGPVLITVEYRVPDANARAFLILVHQLAKQRRRDGAYRWGVFRDAAEPTRYLETFVVESWAEHVRQHHRVTEMDRRLEMQIAALTMDNGARVVDHLLYADPREGGRAPEPTEPLPTTAEPG